MSVPSASFAQSSRLQKMARLMIVSGTLVFATYSLRADPVSMAENPASSPPHNNQPDACAHAQWVARNNAAAMAHTTNISILSQECRNCHTLDTNGTAQQGMTVWVCTAYVQWKRN
jgi:hypothetical protein